MHNTHIPVKPISFNILPISSEESLHSGESRNSVFSASFKQNNNIPQNSNQHNINTVKFHQFNHSPIVPTLVGKPKEVSTIPSVELSLDDKELIRLQRHRENNARYNEKIKDYKKLGTLKTEKEKIISLLLLCYPSLHAMPSYELDRIITELIQRLGV